jgi:DNA-directed RNA polymerase specialized sigma24 family protein
MANYINNKHFHNILVEYRKTGSKKVYEEIGKHFLLVARNFLNKCNFINYSNDRKDEMVSNSVYFMVRYMHKYDESGNPFAYFTQYAYNAFLQYINEKKKIEAMFTSVEYIDNCDVHSNDDYIEIDI